MNPIKLARLKKKLNKLKSRQAQILQAQNKEKAKRDMMFLYEDILYPDEIKSGEYVVADFHRDWAKELRDFWRSDDDLLMLGAPRGSLKSSFITCTFVIQKILANPNIRILIANEREDNAKKFLKIIADHFKYNEILRGMYGDWVSKNNWSQSQLEVTARTKNMREPTVMIGSLETSLVSMHYDLIILDDLQSRQNSISKEQIDKVEQYWKDIQPLLDSGGKVIFTFTRWAYTDVYGRILKTFTKKDTINNKPATPEIKAKWGIESQKKI